MPRDKFDRNALARWYAKEHLKTDPGICSIHFLPSNSPAREIRLIEVNKLLGERSDDTLQPIDFGVDTGTETEHKLFVLDVTPRQWDRIAKLSLPLPPGWSLKDAVPFEQN